MRFGIGGEPEYWTTADADPRHLQHNMVVAIDPARALDNGQPSLLALWIHSLRLQPQRRRRGTPRRTVYVARSVRSLSRLALALLELAGVQFAFVSHISPMEQGPDDPPGRRRVLVLLLSQVHLQDMAGPVQVLDEASRLGGGYQLSFCGVTSRLRSAQGLMLADLQPLPEPESTDTVLIPGISSASLDPIEGLPRAWLVKARRAGARLASVCTGAFALASAGVLDGLSCTTHWKMIDRLRREFPRARVLDNLLFVEDQGVVTSAGVASGIDMALSLVEADYGPLVVSRVAREMVVYLRRNGDHEQRSAFLDHRTHLHPGVHRVQDWIVAHPDRKPALEELGRIAAMSPRNLARVFRAATGTTPKQFAARVKVQVARDLLEDPQRSVEQIAASCGFEDARQLRRLWQRSFGTSIAAFRRSQEVA